MKSKFIAISAISASFVAIVLIIGAYISFFDVYALLLSSVFVILPLYFNTYKGCFLCYLVGGVVALLCGLGNITSIVYPGYFAFFGLYPIVKFIASNKKFNKIVFMFLGLLWCVACAYGLFFYYTEFLGLELNDFPEFISNNILYFVGAFAIVFYFLYDKTIYFVKIIEDRYLQRIIR